MPGIPLIDVKAQYAPLVPELQRAFAEVLESGTFILGGAGTSASAPHVTGLVAQLIAKYGKGQPSQIKQLLLNGVDDLGAPGKDPFYGAGRINVAKALSQ